jgi:phosphoribosylaminoimidazole (AIR) synthetase
VFTQVNDGVDKIQDFTVGTDLIELRNIFPVISAATQFELFIQLTQGGANTRLSVNEDGIGTDFKVLAVLQNTDTSSLSPINFAVT